MDESVCVVPAFKVVGGCVGAHFLGFGEEGSGDGFMGWLFCQGLYVNK